MGIPSIMLAGIASVVVLGGFLYLFISNNDVNSVFGVTREISLQVAGVIIGVGAIWYVVATMYNKRRGVDTGLVYRAIPPD